VQGLQRRELPAAELVEALRGQQILEPVLAEIGQLEVLVQEASRRLGDEHLAAVTCAHHAGGPVHVDPHVPLVGDERLAGVHSHSHPHPRCGEVVLSGRRRCDGVRRPLEGNEERIDLRIHLDAAVAAERIPEDAPVLRQDLRIPVSEPCSSRVEPSMSVNRNVTVPAGSSRIGLVSTRKSFTSTSRKLVTRVTDRSQSGHSVGSSRSTQGGPECQLLLCASPCSVFRPPSR
jgi:hypothetical protein